MIADDTVVHGVLRLFRGVGSCISGYRRLSGTRREPTFFRDAFFPKTFAKNVLAATTSDTLFFGFDPTRDLTALGRRIISQNPVPYTLGAYGTLHRWRTLKRSSEAEAACYDI